MANLITVADYKSYAGITSTKFDTQISNIVTAISAIIKKMNNLPIVLPVLCFILGNQATPFQIYIQTAPGFLLVRVVI